MGRRGLRRHERQLQMIDKYGRWRIAEVTDHDLALVGNVRGHPGDKYVAVDIEAGVRPGENALNTIASMPPTSSWHPTPSASSVL